MPTFSYQAINIDGGETTGKVEAGNLAAAVDRIRTQGLFPSSITPDVDSLSLTGLLTSLPFSKRTREVELAHFSRELADFLNSGVPLPLSLSVLSDRQKPGRFKNILHELADDVRAGNTLSESMAKHPKLFDVFFMDMVRAGEGKNALPDILDHLAGYMGSNRELKSKSQKIFRIPVAMFMGASIYLLFLFVFVAPKFAEIFADLGGALPTPTQFLMDMSHFFHNSYRQIILLSVGLTIGVKLLLTLRIARTVRDTAVLMLPIWGKIIRDLNMARFTRILGALMGIGIPFAQAIDIAKEAIRNRMLSKTTAKTMVQFRDGRRARYRLKGFRSLDPNILNMISIPGGEREQSTGLLKIADSYDRRAMLSMDNILTFLVPGMVLFLGFLFFIIYVSLTPPICVFPGALL